MTIDTPRQINRTIKATMSNLTSLSFLLSEGDFSQGVRCEWESACSLAHAGLVSLGFIGFLSSLVDARGLFAHKSTCDFREAYTSAYVELETDVERAGYRAMDDGGTGIMSSVSLSGYAFVMLRRVLFMSSAVAIACSMVIKARAAS